MKLYLAPETCPQLPDLLALAEERTSARDFERALALHGRALELLADLPPAPGLLEQKSALRNARAGLSLHLGHWQQALEDLDRVLGHQGDLEDPGLLVQARTLQATIQGYYGEYAEALEVLDRALPLARTLPGPREEARVLLRMGTLLASLGEHRRAQEALERVLELLPQAEDPEAGVLRAAALTQVGLAAFRARRGQVARDRYRESLALLERWAPESEGEAETWRYLGVLWSVRGRFREALRHHRRALELYLKLRMPLGQAKVYSSIGQTCLELSRLDEALYFMRRAERLCLALGADAELAAVYGKLGAIHLQREEPRRAVELHRRDVDLSRRFGNLRALAFAIRNLGLSLRAQGELDEAEARLQEALERFRELDDPSSVMRVHLDLAEARLDQGKIPQAEESLEQARTMQGVDTPDPDRARLWLLTGTLNRLRQRRDDAQEAYLEALRILAEVGPSGAMAQARFELGQLHEEARDREQALYHLRECMVLARQLGMSHLVARAARHLERLAEVELVNLLIEDLEDPLEAEEEGPSGR